MRDVTRACLAQGCDACLSEATLYCFQHKLCATHLKAASITRKGCDAALLWRFCHQCAKLQPVSAFDGCKRTCRSQLARRRAAAAAAKHQRRRRRSSSGGDGAGGGRHPALAASAGGAPCGSASAGSSGRAAAPHTPQASGDAGSALGGAPCLRHAPSCSGLVLPEPQQRVSWDPFSLGHGRAPAAGPPAAAASNPLPSLWCGPGASLSDRLEQLQLRHAQVRRRLNQLELQHLEAAADAAAAQATAAAPPPTPAGAAAAAAAGPAGGWCPSSVWGLAPAPASPAPAAVPAAAAAAAPRHALPHSAPLPAALPAFGALWPECGSDSSSGGGAGGRSRRSSARSVSTAALHLADALCSLDPSQLAGELAELDTAEAAAADQLAAAIAASVTSMDAATCGGAAAAAAASGSTCGSLGGACANGSFGGLLPCTSNGYQAAAPAAASLRGAPLHVLPPDMFEQQLSAPLDRSDSMITLEGLLECALLEAGTQVLQAYCCPHPQDTNAGLCVGPL